MVHLLHLINFYSKVTWKQLVQRNKAAFCALASFGRNLLLCCHCKLMWNKKYIIHSFKSDTFHSGPATSAPTRLGRDHRALNRVARAPLQLRRYCTGYAAVEGCCCQNMAYHDYLLTIPAQTDRHRLRTLSAIR